MVVVCSIENIDPMGVHTGDSITVAPAMTLTDREYQRMRDTAIAIIREVGVDTGGCNIQFAVDPRTGQMVVIEMNPRVSRSSALASKATGFPIAKIAAQLAIGYTLDEIPNDITGQTPACFEPALDYVVVKVPRFAFEKFPGADPTLTTHMKSVGEAMAIGRTFPEALQKALRSLESSHGPFGFEQEPPADADRPARARPPPARRPPEHRRTGRCGPAPARPRSRGSPASIPGSSSRSSTSTQIAEQVRRAPALDARTLATAKQNGFSDAQIAGLRGTTEAVIRGDPLRAGDQAGVQARSTPAPRSSPPAPRTCTRPTTTRPRSAPGTTPKVIILGSGPNRIGQGIEFDYCCVHAAFALAEARLRDRDGQLQPRDGLHRLRHLRPAVLRAADPGGRAGGRATRSSAGELAGVIVQLGGQTPLAWPGRWRPPACRRGHLARGHPPGRGPRALRPGARPRPGLPRRATDGAPRRRGASAIAREIGYPVLVRPVLRAGRARPWRSSTTTPRCPTT